MAFPPEVWAVVAASTYSKRSIACIGRVCKASHDGVTNLAHPWRMLERKYGIQPAENPERARENTIKYVKERRVIKRGLENFANCGFLTVRGPGLPQPTLTLQFWEKELGFVKSYPTSYYVFLTALFDKPVVDTVPIRIEERVKQIIRKVKGDETSRVLAMPSRGEDVWPERDIAMLCAVYTAVRKPGANILLYHDTDDSLWPRIVMFLEAFDGGIVQGLPPSKWVVYTTELDHDNKDEAVGTWIHLRNSSSILVCSTDAPSPPGPQFYGANSFVIRAGHPTLREIAPQCRFPERSVHFAKAYRRSVDEILTDSLF